MATTLKTASSFKMKLRILFGVVTWIDSFSIDRIDKRCDEDCQLCQSRDAAGRVWDTTLRAVVIAVMGQCFSLKQCVLRLQVHSVRI